MLRIGRITILPPKSPDKFLADATVELHDGDQPQPILTISNFVVGISKWDDRIYAATPASFIKVGNRGWQMERAVEFESKFWKQLSQAIVAEFLKVHPDYKQPEPLTPDWISKEVAR